MSELHEDQPGRLPRDEGQPEQPKQPSGWKQVGLSDILTEPQIQQLSSILNANRNDAEDALKAMKQYFGTLRTELEAKGVDANYLAYFLYAKLTGAI
jgi:hypothetical protein